MSIQPDPNHDEQNSILEAFNKCPEFTAFSDREKVRMANLVKTEKFQQNKQVFSMEQQGQKFFIVIYGKFQIRLKSNTYIECKAGDMFGEIAVLSRRHRLGTVLALEPSKLVVFDRDTFFNPEVLPTEMILKLAQALTQKMISYFYRDELLSSLEMIRRGENEGVEFKTSMNKAVREPVIRTLSAFMNLNGGTIFLGVRNDGSIKGVSGGMEDFDQFQLSTRHLLRKKLGAYFDNLVHFSIEEIEGKNILRIDCDSSKSPVFFHGHNGNGEELEEFVIRSGAANVKLKKGSEIIRYYQKRYKH